jgi:hypothetical protein
MDEALGGQTLEERQERLLAHAEGGAQGGAGHGRVGPAHKRQRAVAQRIVRRG